MKKCGLFIFGLLLSIIAIAQSGTQKISLSDVLSGQFHAKSVSGISSMKNGEEYSLKVGLKIVKQSYKTGKEVGVLFDLALIEDAPINNFSDYVLNEDESKLMVAANSKKKYRHSKTRDYFVYSIEKKTFEALSENGQQQEAAFSPDGTRIAFVRNNNIFIKDLRFGTEKQITADGEFNKIINGVPDWVYEEEFAFSKAFEWSPDGRFLAFLRFDESEVKEYSFPVYEGASPEKVENELYPGSYRFKYPKSGEKNSVVTVHVFDVKNNATKEMDLTDEKDYYVPRIKWSQASDKLCIFKLNRHQDKMEYYFANPQTTICTLFHTEKNERYISENNLDHFYFIQNKWFVTLSEKDGYNHAYLYRLDGTLVKQLTKGEFDVTDFYGYDAKRKVFYYQAAAKSPLQREVYVTDLSSKKNRVLTPVEGTNRVIFSHNFNYYVHYFNSATVPMVVTVANNKSEVQRTLEDNKLLKSTVSNYQFNPKEFFTFSTSEGISLNGWMVKPLNFDAQKKYPVLMIQYSGPGSQQVLDKWTLGWEHALASEGYLVACVDGRGTGARGEAFKKSTYMQLGHLESDDQIEAARYLGALDFVDESRIGIWGWSYGGFMSALCLSRSNVFKIGIAVAPVTHYKFYDSVYTERFMRTPKENLNGYDTYAPLNLADSLSGRLLLVHGTADDNVHYQNTIEYAERLVQAGKQFEMQVYNNRNHSIYGGKTRAHLYTRKMDFIKAYL